MVRDLTDKHPNYYEATVQLRDVSQEVVNFVEEEINRAKIIVSKVEEVKTGLDYYLADVNQAKALGRLLQERFGGDFKMTSSIFGRKDGKEIYRVTILFREASFRKKDLVIYQGEEHQVIAMGKDIMLKNLKNHKKIHVKYKEMDQMKKIDAE